MLKTLRLTPLLWTRRRHVVRAADTIKRGRGWRFGFSTLAPAYRVQALKMNYILFSILALLRILCVEEHLLHTASPLSSPIHWMDAVGYFPSLYIMLQTGIMFEDAEHQTQASIDSRPPPLLAIVNAPVSKAYLSRLVRRQVSPVPVIPPRQGPTCVNRRLLPPFEIPGPMSVHDPFPQPKCKLDARPVHFAFPWTPLTLSGLLMLVAWTFSQMDTALPREVSACTSASMSAMQETPSRTSGFTIAPRRKVDARKLHPTRVMADGRHIPVPAPSHSSSFALSFSLLNAPSSPGADGVRRSTPPILPRSSSTLAVSPNVGFKPSTVCVSRRQSDFPSWNTFGPIDGANRVSGIATPVSSSLSTSTAADGLTIWAPMFVPTPVIVAPTPQRPFVYGFAGVNDDICSVAVSIAAPSMPSPPRGVLDAGTCSASNPAAVVAFAPQQCELFFGQFDTPVLSTTAATSFIGSSSPTPASTSSGDVTSSTIKLNVPANPPSPLLECEKRAVGLSRSIHAPPLPTTLQMKVPATPFSPALKRDVGLSYSIHAPPPSSALPLVGAGVKASIHARPAASSSSSVTKTPMSAPCLPSLPTFECEKYGVGISASIHAPRRAADAPLQPIAPSCPPSTNFTCEKAGAGARVSIHAPQRAWSPRHSAAAPILPPSVMFTCEKKGVGVSASIHALRPATTGPERTKASSSGGFQAGAMDIVLGSVHLKIEA
ncbi:hypothetical protein LshimejAT787_1203310 [Lyophyllum shimeji]|uniref:Uncharacterized protein n=1 Tax=Lyophyllum shimeji TaxID=47721 RepID=A0A9P3US49_LYOSH|nr:hypothetical protein LshimejAT787_1203310 [Lyophyllum shimeji]